MIALTLGTPIGIDVELLRETVNHQRLATQYFSPAEQNALEALCGEQLVASFFAGWTRKEALLKATGTGIAGGLDSFDVSIDPAMQRQCTALQTANGSTEQWWIESLPCGEGFAGAMAYRRVPDEVRIWPC
jgi:4'-phosphopantetheinyl transferase